jgi:hypothetical protein
MNSDPEVEGVPLAPGEHREEGGDQPNGLRAEDRAAADAGSGAAGEAEGVRAGVQEQQPGRGVPRQDRR